MTATDATRRSAPLPPVPIRDHIPVPLTPSLAPPATGSERTCVYPLPMPTLVVLPTYEEAANIEEVLRRLRAAVPGVDVLVVDDSSPDGTAKLAKAVGYELGRVDVAVRPHKSGLGSAYQAGFRHALRRGYELVVGMDSDLSHDPAALPVLLQASQRGADLVVGSRYVSGGRIGSWARHRRSLSRYGNRYAARLLGLDMADATSGLRVYRTEALARVDLDAVRANGFAFQIEMAYRIARDGGRVVEVPIEFLERSRGTSKMCLRIVVEALVLVTWWGVRDRLRRLRSRPQAALTRRSQRFRGARIGLVAETPASQRFRCGLFPFARPRTGGRR